MGREQDVEPVLRQLGLDLPSEFASDTDRAVRLNVPVCGLLMRNHALDKFGSPNVLGPYGPEVDYFQCCR